MRHCTGKQYLLFFFVVEFTTAQPTEAAMELPMKTNIPLGVLDSDVNRFLAFQNPIRAESVLRGGAISKMWALLLYSEQRLLKVRNMGPKTFRDIKDALATRGLAVGALAEYADFWCETIEITRARTFCVPLHHAVSNYVQAQLSDAEREQVVAFCRFYGMRTDMRTEELFESACHTLSVAQVRYLRANASTLFAAGEELASTYEQYVVNELRCATVWDVASHVTHLHPTEFNGAAGRLRAKIEAVVGRLPLCTTFGSLDLVRKGSVDVE